MGRHLTVGIDEPRVCTKCGIEQPAGNFYKRTKTRRRRECKTCWSEKCVEYTAAHRERTNELNRASSKRNGHKSKSAYRDRNPIKRRAHEVVAYALRVGKLARASTCAECGETGGLHAHHDDYARPLEIRWLCPLHHKQWHAENGEGTNPR